MTKEYKDGDTAWFIPHFRGAGMIAIKVTLKVDDFFRKSNTNAYLFYDADEPVGHDLSFNELIETEEEAKEELLARFNNLFDNEDPDLNLDISDYSGGDLNRYRSEQIAWLQKNHMRANNNRQCNCGCMNVVASIYKKKQQGKDWFAVTKDGKIK